MCVAIDTRVSLQHWEKRNKREGKFVIQIECHAHAEKM